MASNRGLRFAPSHEDPGAVRSNRVFQELTAPRSQNKKSRCDESVLFLSWGKWWHCRAEEPRPEPGAFASAIPTLNKSIRHT